MINSQFTLSELNIQIRDTLENAFSGLVWVKAEISEITVNRTGHCYLELVEMDPLTRNIEARARATIWSYTFRMLKPYFETTTGQAFSRGINILVSVKVEYHPVFGLSLNIRDIDPSYTMGDMALKRREIILRLQEDGVADMNKELELPLVPQRVAIISSPTAAGLQDFMNQLSSNPYQIRFYTKLFPAVMQGTETAASIIAVLDQVFLYDDFFDVVVIIRGGGAQLDLASFDHYDLAFHVAQFPLPVITGIGHDKDETVIDLVAHTRLKTPTAVAEFLISGAAAFVQHIQEAETMLNAVLSDRIEKEQAYLTQAMQQVKQGVITLVRKEEYLFGMTTLKLQNAVPLFLKNQKNLFIEYRHRLQSEGRETIRGCMQQLTERGNNLKIYSRYRTNDEKKRLRQVQVIIGDRAARTLKLLQSQLSAFDEKTRLVDPYKVLKRGYSLTFKNGKLVKSVNELKEGEVLVTHLADGRATGKILKTENYDSKEDDLQRSSY